MTDTPSATAQIRDPKSVSMESDTSGHAMGTMRSPREATRCSAYPFGPGDRST